MSRQAIFKLLRQQQLYLAIAAIVWAIFWALGMPLNPIVTIVYSLLLGNMGTFIMERLYFLYGTRHFPYNWLSFLLIVAAMTPVIVTIATTGVYFQNKPPYPPFWPYLRTSWKFPSVVTVVFAVVFNFYRQTKERLEKRNTELQSAVELGRIERELQDQELQRAREIQRALMPEVIPQIPGFEVAGAWEPARVVGGDYFDVIRLGPRKLGICIADVVGKSVSAALLMANVQATVRAFASEAASPAEVCSRVNAVLANNIAPGKFVTLFYGVLDGDRSSLEYCDAGHPPPVLVRAHGPAQALDAKGAVLGVFPDWQYENSNVRLTPGDALLLFTDGITEAASSDDEEFGEERLLSAVEARDGLSASELQLRVLSDVKAFCNSQFRDDVTLIVISALKVESKLEQANVAAVCGRA